MNGLSLEVLQPSVAQQQPQWGDPAEVEQVRDALAALPPLVETESLDRLRGLLAEVAAGQAQVVQAGDCAEDPAECTAGDVQRKVGLLNVLADVMNAITHQPVVRVGRIGGQYAKPRSAQTELVGGVEIPVYRGHMVNGPEPDPEARRPDPRRLLAGYRAASRLMANLCPTPQARLDPAVWTSHEALLLDYEIPMLRRNRDGRVALTSTHWPWIGERTRRPEGAHVALLADVVNPIACKVGPQMTVAGLLGLCERLDPEKEPGRLTLIARLGADAARQLLPPLVRAVQAAGYPVVWLVDPMHSNTVTTAEGRKTRVVETIVREVGAFQAAVRGAGGIPGGIHLETTPDTVTECADAPNGIDRIGEKYTTLCDPRLNPRQAVAVVSAWQTQMMTNRAEGESCRA
ncbi:3-deoxy-7-phosphoheptulonate synthase [Streptomyces sp. NBC_00424]|uniref:3-deoxy-7-phosphoheptulonate synthase n=1 Tax=Streptomyces sp. NBC_00424 TaxID=2903648 RepID=UPI00224C94AF|nr:3-deoxy-7-phosphoheptulonate synthase [Streptomyces sp. NBC_00424]MCX5077797.1 3-deoxy-7-phosphoheptulonate synthase [Streptomyces sp. NBC_00424]